MFAAWDQPPVMGEREVERAPGPANGAGMWTDQATDARGAGCALDHWLGSMRPYLVRLARRFLWNADDAEEIAQDATVLAWQHIRGLAGQARRNAWLYRTTVNLCLNRLRRGRTAARAVGEPPDRPAATGPPPGNAELADRVRLVMSRLPERQHAAFVLRELEGLSYKQVAAIMGTRSGAVRLLVHRAREGMRRMLLEQWPETFGPER